MDLSVIPVEWILLIPHWLLALLLLVFGTPGLFSYIVGAAKRITGTPKPTDSTAKRRWFIALAIGDKLALNAATVKCGLEKMTQRQMIAEQARLLLQQQEHVQTQAENLKETKT